MGQLDRIEKNQEVIISLLEMFAPSVDKPLSVENEIAMVDAQGFDLVEYLEKKAKDEVKAEKRGRSCKVK